MCSNRLPCSSVSQPSYSAPNAGLTLGLLSINEMELEVLKRSGTDHEKRCAAKIVPLLKRPHHLLITLVLANAMATEVKLVPMPQASFFSIFGSPLLQAVGVTT